MIRNSNKCRVKRELLIVLTTFLSSAFVTLQFLVVIEERQMSAIEVTPYDLSEQRADSQDLNNFSKNKISNDIQSVKFKLSQADYNESYYSNENEKSVSSAYDDYEAVARTKPVPLSLDDNPGLVLNKSMRYQHMLTVRPSGRLGNLMFSYAALIGISRRNLMIPVLPMDSPLRSYFSLSVPAMPTDRTTKWWQFEEEEACSHDLRTEELNYSLDIELLGFFQSWKYFRDIPKIVKNEFTFKPSVINVAKTFMYSAIRKLHGVQTSPGAIVTVGIHFRRGDMLSRDNVLRGYTVATIDYIDTAMSYFLAKYGADKLLFIVCSDEPDYIRDKLSELSITSHAATVYADLTSFQLEMASVPTLEDIEEPEVQLCLLSLCKHSIITTGSFSWWAGWLSNGTVLYYMDFPTPYSPLDDEFLADDYYPPHWIGIP